MKLLGKYHGIDTYEVNGYDEYIRVKDAKSYFVFDGQLIYKDKIRGTVDSDYVVIDCSPRDLEVPKKLVSEANQLANQLLDQVLVEAMKPLRIENTIDLKSMMYKE